MFTLYLVLVDIYLLSVSVLYVDPIKTNTHTLIHTYTHTHTHVYSHTNTLYSHTTLHYTNSKSVELIIRSSITGQTITKNVKITKSG